MDSRLRSLYKRVLWAARAYPGIGGIAEVRGKAKAMLSKVPAGSPPDVVDKAFDRGITMKMRHISEPQQMLTGKHMWDFFSWDAYKVFVADHIVSSKHVKPVGYFHVLPAVVILLLIYVCQFGHVTGEYILKELEALNRLHKYRSMKRRYE